MASRKGLTVVLASPCFDPSSPPTPMTQTTGALSLTARLEAQRAVVPSRSSSSWAEDSTSRRPRPERGVSLNEGVLRRQDPATSCEEPIMKEQQPDDICINAIRFLAVDAVQQANSGHPGLPMGAAAMAYVLWTRFLRHNPADPHWPDRDRFVLSAGHGSMLLYALMHLTGYDLPMEEIKRFRQWGSRTTGHPESHLTRGVEATTGPLGQGISNAVGMAIAEAHLAARFNRPGHEVIDHHTYVLAGDGDLMEGVASEACSLAGHLGLG